MLCTFPRNDKGKFYMDPLKVANKRSVPGVVVFNIQQEPILLNRVARAILSKFNGAKPHLHRKTIVITIPKEISNLFEKLKKKLEYSLSGSYSHIPLETTLLPRGATNYCCLGSILYNQTSSSIKPFYIMVLIEKIPEHRNIDLDQLKKLFRLTDRQMMIVKLLFSGLTNKEIANRLFVCEDTIKSHMKHVMRRLGVNSRTEIVSMMFEL